MFRASNKNDILGLLRKAALSEAEYTPEMDSRLLEMSLRRTNTNPPSDEHERMQATPT
jgi:hypothetical protein